MADQVKEFLGNCGVVTQAEAKEGASGLRLRAEDMLHRFLATGHPRIAPTLRECIDLDAALTIWMWLFEHTDVCKTCSDGQITKREGVGCARGRLMHRALLVDKDFFDNYDADKGAYRVEAKR
jgi:hypothetical protein